MDDFDVAGAENPTPEAKAREALRAAGWTSDGADNWRPGSPLRLPKVGPDDAYAACRGMMVRYAPECYPVRSKG